MDSTYDQKVLLKWVYLTKHNA